MLSSGQDMAVTHMISWHFWLYRQDLLKIKAVKNAAWGQGGALKAPLQAEGLLTVDGCWGSKSHFCLGL